MHEAIMEWKEIWLSIKVEKSYNPNEFEKDWMCELQGLFLLESYCELYGSSSASLGNRLNKESIPL